MNASQTTHLTTDHHAFTLLETVDPLTSHVMRTYRHRSGFLVKILPRPGFSRRFAALTVPYGSIHTTFVREGLTTTVPDGSAHFLEHCVFSRDEQGGLLGRLSALGASANAYTSHTHTMYYFSSVASFSEGLELYLDAVLNPYLETDRIDVERPVILAELDQYLDDPDTVCYVQLLNSLYHNHPVRQDIGGTAASVKQITSEHLKSVWSTFYQPGMLSLTLVGDLEEMQILKSLGARLATAQPVRGQAVLDTEPETPENQPVIKAMDVSAPSFLVGIKDPTILPQHPLEGRELVLRQRMARLAFDTLLSPASALYEKLFERGLINDSFGYHYACEPNFAFLAAGGESKDPQAAGEALIIGLQHAWRQGLDPELFEIQKRAAAGDFVRSLDSIEHSGLVQAQCNQYGLDLFDYPALYDKMNAETAMQQLGFLGDPASYTMSIITRQSED
ncbi:MAG: pitrilysin family protein [Eubacteriales bacterium]|nr:pitrilysin family protein [Eubacteriales bacterium]